jgi:hypothetical protein
MLAFWKIPESRFEVAESQNFSGVAGLDTEYKDAGSDQGQQRPREGRCRSRSRHGLILH